VAGGVRLKPDTPFEITIRLTPDTTDD